MSKICTNCETENVDEAKFCRQCGKQDFKNELKKNDTENKLSDKEINDILNIQVETKDNLYSTDMMIKEFDKQFRKCIAQQILPDNYFITSNIVRDKRLGENYVTTISNMELCLMKSDKIIQTYIINDKTLDLCEKKANEMTAENISKKNTGYISFFSIITMISLPSIFGSDYAMGNIVFFSISLLSTILMSRIIMKKNEEKVNLFYSRLKIFIEKNYIK